MGDRSEVQHAAGKLVLTDSCCEGTNCAETIADLTWSRLTFYELISSVISFLPFFTYRKVFLHQFKTLMDKTPSGVFYVRLQMSFFFFFEPPQT